MSPTSRSNCAEGGGSGTYSAPALIAVFPRARNACPPPAVLRSLQILVSPYMSYTVHDEEPDMINLTQSFEFSAAHRLHCEHLSDEENIRTFGKCSNPNGHGHNYQVEVSVKGPVDGRSGTVVDLPALQQTVNECVIERFDHKHLNRDCEEFAALNPSVENIARVIWDLLADRFAPAKLAMVRVWETPKTYAEYRGPNT